MRLTVIDIYGNQHGEFDSVLSVAGYLLDGFDEDNAWEFILDLDSGSLHGEELFD